MRSKTKRAAAVAHGSSSKRAPVKSSPSTPRRQHRSSDRRHRRACRRNQPEELPAILLARMAVDSRHSGRGLGAALLKHFMLKALEVAQSVGVRVLLIHAKDDEAKSFYMPLRIRRISLRSARLGDVAGRCVTEPEPPALGRCCSKRPLIPCQGKWPRATLGGGAFYS